MDVLDPAFPLQVRAARVLLGYSQKQLATAAGVSEPFIARLERGQRLGQSEKLRMLRDTLMDLGVEFVSETTVIGVNLTGRVALERREEWGNLRA